MNGFLEIFLQEIGLPLSRIFYSFSLIDLILSVCIELIGEIFKSKLLNGIKFS